MIEYEDIIKERIEYMVNEDIRRMEFMIDNLLICIYESYRYEDAYEVSLSRDNDHREYVIETNGKVWEEREGELYEIYGEI